MWRSGVAAGASVTRAPRPVTVSGRTPAPSAAAASSATDRSVACVSRASASERSTQRTSSNSASWSSGLPPTARMRKKCTVLLKRVRAADEEVADGLQRSLDLDLEPGLLPRLADGGLLEGLARIGRALRQRPERRAAPMGEGDLDAPVELAVDDTTGRRGARGPQDRPPRSRYARRARGNPNGSAGRRAGRRVARPTAGKRKRLVWERSEAHARHRPARRGADGGRPSVAGQGRGATDGPSGGSNRSRWMGGRRSGPPDSLAWSALYARSIGAQAIHATCGQRAATAR